MIVTDEDHIMESSLNKIGYFVDAIVIDFNGKGKRTPEIIKEYATKHNIPYSVRQTVWKDHFGNSRTDAIRAGEKFLSELEKSDEFLDGSKRPEGPLTAEEWKKIKPTNTWYLMTHDADNELRPNGLRVSDDFPDNQRFQIDKTKLEGDGIMIDMTQDGSSRYSYRWMTKVDFTGRRKWKWYEPLHEYLKPEGNWSEKFQKIEGAYMISGRTGARSSDPVKYLKDAVVFERYIKTDEGRNNRRAFFYRAQSYRDAQKPREAYDCYCECASYTDGFVEERYMALVNAGKLAQQLFKDQTKSLDHFHMAHELRSSRLEATFVLIELYKSKGHFRSGWNLGKPYIENEYPKDDVLFVDQAIHYYRFYVALGDCAYMIGLKEEARKLYEKGLKYEYIKAEDRAAIVEKLNPERYK